MLTSNCRICGGPKDPSEYALNECRTCSTLGNEAVQHAVAENPTATPDQLLYVRRQAMSQRALHPGRNYIDPRKFSGYSGMIPVPPQSGDRGNPTQ